MKVNLDEKKIKEYYEIFNYVENNFPDWERLQINDKFKIKTNQEEVKFSTIEEILKKFNLRITDISFSDYYGITFGIEKLETI